MGKTDWISALVFVSLILVILVCGWYAFGPPSGVREAGKSYIAL